VRFPRLFFTSRKLHVKINYAGLFHTVMGSIDPDNVPDINHGHASFQISKSGQQPRFRLCYDDGGLSTSSRTNSIMRHRHRKRVNVHNTR
jgi:hypothetical protein